MVPLKVEEQGPSIGRTPYANVLAIQGTWYIMKISSAGVACSNLLPPFSCRRVADHFNAILIHVGLAKSQHMQSLFIIHGCKTDK